MGTTRTLHQCRSCGAEILWTVTAANGERMPVDAHPAAGGNVRLINGVAHVVGATIDLFDPDDDGVRHYPHFATCPEGAEWSRR